MSGLLVPFLLLGVPLQNEARTLAWKKPSGHADNKKAGDDDKKAPASKTGASRAQVLVVVSDHGSGTSNFGESLKKHPCMYDVGEVFGAGYMLWSTSKVAECVGKAPNSAMFDSVTHAYMNQENPKMAMKLNNVLDNITASKRSDNLDSTSLYPGLSYNLAEYFVRTRDLICANVPADVCPPSDCSITLKMFPQFVDGITFGVRTSVDKKHIACQNAQNEMAMAAWKEALTSFKQSPKVASITLERDELQRQFSMFHRMDPLGQLFECSIPREATAFATVSKDYTDSQIQVEDCWRGEKGAAKCLGDALALVGLSVKLDVAGTQDMAGEVAEREAAHEMTSRSCATDPQATFRLLEGDQVELASHGPMFEAAAEEKLATKGPTSTLTSHGPTTDLRNLDEDAAAQEWETSNHLDEDAAQQSITREKVAAKMAIDHWLREEQRQETQTAAH